MAWTGPGSLGLLLLLVDLTQWLFYAMIGLALIVAGHVVWTGRAVRRVVQALDWSRRAAEAAERTAQSSEQAVLAAADASRTARETALVEMAPVVLPEPLEMAPEVTSMYLRNYGRTAAFQIVVRVSTAHHEGTIRRFRAPIPGGANGLTPRMHVVRHDPDLADDARYEGEYIIDVSFFGSGKAHYATRTFVNPELATWRYRLFRIVSDDELVRLL